MLLTYKLYSESLDALPDKQLLITTLNAHSYNVACKDAAFAEALQKSDVLIPDGVSVVLASRLFTGQRLKKIAGAELFFYEMNKLDNRIKNQEPRQEKIEKAKAMFLGSTDSVLHKIRERAGVEFSHVEVYTYSPPYTEEFTVEENAAIIDAINSVHPDVLFVGMTAPKQEKLKIKNCHVCCIGAVFDFYAGTVHRAPKWMIGIGLEWFYRLIKEPRRMWKRYLIGNVKFIGYVVKEKFSKKVISQ
jgi:N-acetylglucosaminyldiphosphoundecaprenol N-acetyl-beta-D-mannosaminyltransferase